MRRNVAREIAKTITNQQLLDMMNTAKENITDWTKVSSVNKSFTKGVAWNILCKDFDLNYDYHISAKANMIREFGDYLPEELKPKKVVKPKINPTHQNPIF